MSDDKEVDYAALAAEDGWVPQADWKGPAERWVDAKTFVERGAQILPIVQAKNRKLVETVDELKRTVAEIQEGSKSFREFSEKAIERERAEKAQLVADLEKARQQAVTDGDGEAFAKADKALAQARAETVGPTPEVQGWLNDNAWYTTDDTLRAVADRFSEKLKKENPALKGRAFLDKITEHVKAELPNKFGAKREPTTEDNVRKTQTKVRSYETLPPEARAACDKFVKTIPGFTKEAYLSQYDWSEA